LRTKKYGRVGQRGCTSQPTDTTPDADVSVEVSHLHGHGLPVEGEQRELVADDGRGVDRRVERAADPDPALDSVDRDRPRLRGVVSETGEGADAVLRVRLGEPPWIVRPEPQRAKAPPQVLHADQEADDDAHDDDHRRDGVSGGIVGGQG
jgi:hypothetical protein